MTCWYQDGARTKRNRNLAAFRCLQYIEPLFGLYENGADIEEIVGKILEAQGTAPCEGVDMSFMQEFSMAKDRLCMKLVSGEANSELLSEVTYREFLDMAAVYYVDCYNPKISAGMI